MKTGVILDTDIGYDPDDLFALLLLLRNSKIDLIVTSDDPDGKRYIFTKKILEIVDENIKVVQGSPLHKQHFVVDQLILGEKYPIKKDYLKEIKNVIDENEKIIYIGIGSFTNLAKYLDKYPKDKNKIILYQMGGSVEYSRGVDWVEHNVRIDVDSTRGLINSGVELFLVGAQTTFNSKLQIDKRHFIYKKLTKSNKSEHKILKKHIDLYHKHCGNWPFMHDPLTVSAALGKDFVKFYNHKISIDENGNMFLSKNGADVNLSFPKSKEKKFLEFLENSIFS